MSFLHRIRRLLAAPHEAPSNHGAGVLAAGEPSAASKASGPPKKTADVESKCPYCNHTLEQKPLRKKKCPNCGNHIYVRSTPSGQKKVLVTEQQAAEIDDKWHRHHQEKLRDSDPEYRREYEQVKAQLIIKRGSEPSGGDIRWELAKKRLLEYVRNGDWGLYRDTKVEMAQQLQGEGKLRQALGTYLEVCYLDANGPCNRGAKRFDPSQASIAPAIIRQVQELSRGLGLRPDEVKGLFIEAANIYHDGLPVDSAKAWEQILPELKVPRTDNPGLF